MSETVLAILDNDNTNSSIESGFNLTVKIKNDLKFQTGRLNGTNRRW